jgi:hypothetical protein
LELFEIAENDESSAHDIGSFGPGCFFPKGMPEYDALSRLDLRRVKVLFKFGEDFWRRRKNIVNLADVINSGVVCYLSGKLFSNVWGFLNSVLNSICFDEVPNSYSFISNIQDISLSRSRSEI